MLRAIREWVTEYDPFKFIFKQVLLKAEHFPYVRGLATSSNAAGGEKLNHFWCLFTLAKYQPYLHSERHFYQKYTIVHHERFGVERRYLVTKLVIPSQV